MFALVDVNNFYASCERLFRPDLANKPIVVLSNNDGCVIARSNEAKALGIGMAVPYFQIKDICDMHNLAIFSSNYTFYGDISSRVMTVIESCCPDIEIYSIDEVFLDLKRFKHLDLTAFCQSIQKRVLKHIGVPVSIGIGQTKTLAKVASYVAKKKLKQPVYDISDPIQQLKWLPQIDVEDIWGIGRSWSKQLHEMGIKRALELRIANQSMLRKRFGVVMERTARELSGIPCLDMEISEPKQHIVSSKSFGKPQSDIHAIAEALSSYCVRACEKLRAQGSVAGYLNVFLRTNHFRGSEKQYANSIGIKLINPSDDTRAIIACAKRCLTAIYKKGFNYQKVGIMLGDLKPKIMRQTDLFDDGSENEVKSSKTMSLMDTINKKYGRSTIRLAAEGIKQPWKMQSSARSPCYTTRWDDLPIVKA